MDLWSDRFTLCHSFPWIVDVLWLVFFFYILKKLDKSLGSHWPEASVLLWFVVFTPRQWQHESSNGLRFLTITPNILWKDFLVSASNGFINLECKILDIASSDSKMFYPMHLVPELELASNISTFIHLFISLWFISLWIRTFETMKDTCNLLYYWGGVQWWGKIPSFLWADVKFGVFSFWLFCLKLSLGIT